MNGRTYGPGSTVGTGVVLVFSYSGIHSERLTLWTKQELCCYSFLKAHNTILPVVLPASSKFYEEFVSQCKGVYHFK